LGIENKPGATIKKILVYNHYQHVHHTLLLLSAC
jgi:hypothetical protein